MIVGKRVLATWFTCLFCLSVGTVANSQTPTKGETQVRAERIGMSGKELFEHEWKSHDPPAVRQRRRVRATAPALAGLSGNRLGGAGDGLGPLHNAKSCAACHEGGGGSGVDHNVTIMTIDPRSEVLNDRSNGGELMIDLFPGVIGSRGALLFNTVVHDRSTRSGYDAIRNSLADHVPGGIDQHWFIPSERTGEAIAARPVIAGRYESVDYYLSQRNSPALFGLGEIDRINKSRLHVLAARQAEKSDGEITGRVAGKFGWRGQVETLSQFVVGACVGEMGLSQEVVGTTQANDPADPDYANFGVDMSMAEVSKLTEYIAAMRRPTEQAQAGDTAKQVFRGEELFRKIGCQACHVADIHPISGLFTDLLLHDMGPGLQAPDTAPIAELADVSTVAPVVFRIEDPRRTRGTGAAYYDSQQTPRSPKPYPIAKPDQPQFPRGSLPTNVVSGKATYWDTLQREWRTPPLWGVADTGPYLHDGRAATLEQAIRWHGGEAESTRLRFERLDQTDQNLVISFLKSLRAPQL